MRWRGGTCETSLPSRPLISCRFRDGVCANSSGSCITGVCSLSGWVRSTTPTAPLPSAFTSDATGSCVIPCLLSMGAKSLRKPLCPYLRVDPGVDYERAIPHLQPVSNRRKFIPVPDRDALGPCRPRERGKVGLGKPGQLYRPSHGFEVVDLSPVGRVIVDDD